MPFMSYQISDEEACAQCGRFLQEADVDAIKLEAVSASLAASRRSVTPASLSVAHRLDAAELRSARRPQGPGSHVGFGSGSRRGRARVYEAGAQLLLIEAVPPEVAGFIRAELPIPVIGLGAGTEVTAATHRQRRARYFPGLHAQVRKEYADIAGIATAALTEYVTDVRAGAFPADEHCYHMLAGETEKFEEWGRQDRQGAQR